MTYTEAKTHLARKLNIDFSDIANNDLFSDTDLGTFIQLATIKAWDYKFWDVAEHKVTGTTSGGTIAYDQTLQSGSISLLRINGYEYRKLLYQDYLKFLEENPTATDKIWSEYNRTAYVNTNAFTNGQGYELYGKKMPPILTSGSDLLPFSPDADNYEHSGNEAIVQLAYGEALDSEKKKEYAQAEVERKKAYQTLDLLWKPMAEQRASMQILRPMYDVPDFLKTNKNSSQYTGNFNYL